MVSFAFFGIDGLVDKEGGGIAGHQRVAEDLGEMAVRLAACNPRWRTYDSPNSTEAVDSNLIL